jgi:hypothetical protein
MMHRATDSATIPQFLFEFIMRCPEKGNFRQTTGNSNLRELQLGVDKGYFFGIWDKLTAIRKPFEDVMIIRNWWWWQIT